MKNQMLLVFVFSLFVMSGCVSPKKRSIEANGLISLPQARLNVQDYYEGGAYDKDVKRVSREVMEYCSNLPATDGYRAVIMYVEDVLLSTYSVRLNEGFAENKCTQKALDRACFLGELERIENISLLFDYFLSQKIAVFLISRRGEEFRVPVMENLAAQGFSGWTGLYMTPDNDVAYPGFAEKLLAGLQKSGFDIVANITAVPLGIERELGGREFVVPNYLYSGFVGQGF